MNSPELLTVVYETSNELDREAAIYRQLLSSRLKHEDKFSIMAVHTALSTSDIVSLLSDIDSQYVVFIKDTHGLSAGYLNAMLVYLKTHNVYMAEPYMYTGSIPINPADTRLTQSYYFNRDTDIYGAVFNTRRLREFLEAVNNIDRSSIYVSYRLYWNIQKVTPLPVGYSVATNTKAAIGNRLHPEAIRLFPLISCNSAELRTYIIRSLAHFLRGLRSVGHTQISSRHISDLITTFSLSELTRLVEPLQPFEAAWIKSFTEKAPSGFLYKQLSKDDAYLLFHEEAEENEQSTLLYNIAFADKTIKITKKYQSGDLRLANVDASIYDYYSHKISPSSTIIFFDRPMRADDNAEYLYDYFITHYPEYENAVFALNPKSDDWDRLAQKGFKLIPIFTTEFYDLFLESDLVVSSQIYTLRYRGKNLGNSRFVYLQHGIQLNDMSDWVNSKFFDIFIATGKPEEDYLRQFAPVETLNSGLPRLESLKQNPQAQRQILFLPTWRFSLNNSSTENFVRSDYYKALNGILTNPALLNHLEEHDATLQVKLHPNVEARKKLFNFSERVVVCSASYRDAITTSNFVFTDYSSAVLDAAFIGIPVGYYQWDLKEFFLEQPYESRIDYKNQGLGPVFEVEDNLIDYITSMGYEKDIIEFNKRKDIFFEGVNPNKINETIVTRMLSL